MELVNKEVWVIMSKDGKCIAKGNPRDRRMTTVGVDDNYRLLTYTTKAKAESAFRVSSFYNMHLVDGWSWDKKDSDFLHAVKCRMSLELISNEDSIMTDLMLCEKRLVTALAQLKQEQDADDITLKEFIENWKESY